MDTLYNQLLKVCDESGHYALFNYITNVIKKNVIVSHKFDVLVFTPLLVLIQWLLPCIAEELHILYASILN